jgi:hypothetical protein
MKRLIGVAVAVALCGLFWAGCQKKEEPMKGPEAKPMAPMAQPAVPPPPPPPPEGEGK